MSLFAPEHEKSLVAMSETSRRIVLGSLFLYVFRGTDQSEVRDVLKTANVDFDFLSWRRHLHRNGALLRNGKVFIYRRACGMIDRPIDFEISRREGNWIQDLAAYSPLTRRLRALRVAEQRPCMTLQELDSFIVEVLTSPDLVTYIRKYVRRKMNFLRNSYNVTFSELESDLLGWAHYALLRAYPRFDDVGHGLAIAKTIAKRRGVNLIKSLTAQKNNQLITNEDGSCERTTVSMAAIADGTGQFLTADGTFFHRSLMVVGLNGLSAAASNVSWETLHSLKKLTATKNFTPHQRLFLTLMLGEPNEEFTEWLGEPNEDAVERLDYDAYRNKVCNFMGLSGHLASKFLQNLRPHLGGNAD